MFFYFYKLLKGINNFVQVCSVSNQKKSKKKKYAEYHLWMHITSNFKADGLP